MKKLRNVFAETMLSIGTKDKNLIVMVGDISHGILQPFAKKCKNQYYNMGICEPSIMSMASGLSISGMTPVVHTISPFLIERSYEQIKLDFGYQNLGVNIITVGGSFDYSKLGCSHHCYTDISLMAHFKNCKIFIPGSEEEFKKLFIENYKKKQINYFRLPDKNHGVIIKKNKIKTGKGIKIQNGSDITVAVTGYLLKHVMDILPSLKKNKINAEVLYFNSIKPFDSGILRKSLKKTKKLITVEEFSAHDGLYNLCIKSSLDIKIKKIKQLAVTDFIHQYGSFEDLCKFANLDQDSILKEIQKITK